MKHTIIKLLAVTAAALVAGILSSARASTITWTFQENGSNTNLGTSSTFTESGYMLTAYGFAMPNSASDLYAKYSSGSPTETGLGMLRDVGGDHEIDKSHFVQIDTVISPSASVGNIWLGSIQGSENAGIYGSNVLGSIGTQLTTIASDGSVNISSWAKTYKYIGVTDVGSKSAGNTLITSFAATVPDGGATVLLLGLGMVGIGMASRRRKAA